MITRIVKMTFSLENVNSFLETFYASKNKIRTFEGCQGLELLQDIDNDHVFFTYSYWKSQEDLNNYRKSELFNTVWSKTKILFSEKPEAWSCVKK